VKKRSLHWAHLQTLSAVVRGGSQSAAARDLGITHATVGRRLRDLEAALGSAVFARDERGLTLTPTGQAALETAAAMDASAQILARRLAAGPSSIRGRVRLTCTEGIGTDLLPRHLSALTERHPDIALELLIDARTLSLSRRRADLAIRLVRPQEPDLVARRLGDIAFRLYCAAPRAAALGEALRTGQPLAVCRYDASLAELPESRWLDAHLPHASTALTSNSLRALTEACAGGAGVALLPCYAAEARGLHALDTATPPLRTAWLAYPEEYRHTPRYRAVADWVIAAFQAEGARLAGATSEAPA